jgi:RND family efflux transporter MFP subunit
MSSREFEAAAKSNDVVVTMKRIVLIIAITLPIAACGKEQPKKVEVRPVRVTAVQHAASGETISLTGQIQAKDQANLAFRIGGRLRERNVSVGDPVAPGQIVAKIESQDYQNALRSAEADLGSAQAVLANAQNTEGRQSQLLSKGYTTRVQYDQAEQQLKTAQAQVESAQAKLQNAKDNLTYTDLKSDVAGTVTAKGAEPGEVVAAGRMVLQVATQGGRDAVFNVPAQLIRRSPRNPEVTVALSDDPAVVATGHVREVAPQADAATGTYVVKVGLDNPPDTMRLGATIIGQVKMQSEPVIQLPGTALTQSQGKPAVWIVDPESKTVSLFPVTVGHYDTSSISVTDGLKDGDLVVTAGVQALRPGQEVRLLETGAAVQK